MNPSFLIVGLGNPGAKYELTRHNIGFRVVDSMVEKHRASWQVVGEQYCEASVLIMGKEFLILKPLTYMNLSGTAVSRVVKCNHMNPKQVVAVADECNFPTGRVHLRLGGSSGGHNGISSLIEELQSPNFWRLRCGIDRNFGAGELVGYVLAPFPPQETGLVASMISSAVLAVEEIALAGIELAMQKVNRA